MMKILEKAVVGDNLKHPQTSIGARREANREERYKGSPRRRLWACIMCGEVIGEYCEDNCPYCGNRLQVKEIK